MSERPSILDELGRELVRAARAEEARGTSAGRVSRLPRAVVIGVLTLLGLAAVAAAATLVIGRGDPIPIGRAGEVPAELQPVAGTARLNGLDVPDPDGGPVWDVRTSRSKTGAVCATVGQVYKDELGLVGLDRVFRPLPAGAADTCSTAQASGATLAGARAFRGGGRLSDLTVVNGVAARSVRSVVTIAGGRTIRMRLGRDHAFLAVLRGRPEEVRPRLVLTAASGRRTTVRFADTGEYTASDPSGQSPWRLRYSMGNDGLRCIKAERIPGPGVDHVTVPRHCGPRRQPFVAIRRFVPEIPRWLRVRPRRRGGIGATPRYDWGLHPARTVIWGSTQRAGGTVVLTGAGAPRRLRVDATGFRRPVAGGTTLAPAGRGGFLAVLNGRIDPRRLRVTVDGRRLDPNRTFDPVGRPIPREPVPAWRSVASVAPRSPTLPMRVVPGGASISRRAKDPTGGPPWALQTWKARLPAVSPRHAGDVTCFAVGIQERGRLVEPAAGGKRRIVAMGWPDAVCGELRQRRTVAAPDVRTYVDDAASADPRPVRVVVAGMLGDGARSASLLGAGAPRPLSLGKLGTFLTILGPEHAGATLRVREHRRSGVVATSRSPGLLEPHGRCTATAGQSVRVADPEGGPPWITGRGRTNGLKCRYTARLVGGRLAQLLDDRNWVRFGPSTVSVLLDRHPTPRKANRPLVVRVTDTRPGGRPAPAPSGAQIARRTLPGRTVLTGSATRAVTSITLRTPRDVRTVRPGPTGLFLAVYDGAFHSGEIHATARMRDGRTITQTFPVGLF